MKYFYLSLLLVLFSCQCWQNEEIVLTQFSGKPKVPSSIKEGHEYLLEKIHAMTLFKDSTGIAAIKLQDLMIHHFTEE